MESLTQTSVYAPPQADVGAPQAQKPRARLWTTLLAWFVIAPSIALATIRIPLPSDVAWMLVGLVWLGSLAWVIAGYRRALDRAFTRMHAAVLAVGLTLGILLIAAGGMALLMAVFGVLPGMPAGS